MSDNNTVCLGVCNVSENVCSLQSNNFIAEVSPVDVTDSVISDTRTSVQDRFSLSKTDLSVTDLEKVDKILSDFKMGISVSPEDVGKTTIIKHEIKLKNNQPIRQPLRPLKPPHREFVQNTISKYIDLGLIQESKSPWSSPLVIVKKKNGSFRMCEDNRRLNDATIKDSFPLPRINHILDSLGGSQYFCTLDLRNGYYQVEMEDSSRDKTAFPTPFGLYEFLVLPFGLCNAPSTFQRLMNEVLRKELFNGCIVYLDDVVIYGSSVDDTLEKLRRVLKLLTDAGLKINPEKCSLFQKEVKFLGHKISRFGISTDEEKVSAIVEWKTPKCVKELQAFVGLANYYRRFIQDFAKIMAPLNKQLSSTSLNWDTNAEESFKTIKRLLSSAPALAYPDFSKDSDEFILDVDASNVAIGAVLSQRQNGKENIISFGSKSLNKSQKNYSATQRELLALIFFLEHFRSYLVIKPFLVRTDHSALQWLTQHHSSSSMLERWQAKLDEFHFSLVERLPNQAPSTEMRML